MCNERLLIKTRIAAIAIGAFFIGNLKAGETNAPNAFQHITVGREIESYQLTISTTNRAFVLGQPLVLTISLKNVSTNKAAIRVRDGFSNYSFTIINPEGKDVPATESGRALIDASPDFHVSWQDLAPGESFDLSAPVHSLFQITNSGEYTITVSRQVPKRTNRQESAWVPSGPLKIQIIEPVKQSNP